MRLVTELVACRVVSMIAAGIISLSFVQSLVKTVLVLGSLIIDYIKYM